MKLICWPDAELICENGEYVLIETVSKNVIDRIFADSEEDAICSAAAKYGLYLILEVLEQFKSKPIYLH